MGSRVVVSIGIVLLIAGGRIWAATNQVSGSATGTQTGAGPRPRAPASYRVRIYQLQRPATENKAQQPLKDPQSLENAKGTSEQLVVEELVDWPSSIEGPDLNPPLGPETRVLFQNPVGDLCPLGSV